MASTKKAQNLLIAASIAIAFFTCGTVVYGQNGPAFKDYKGVVLGMPAADVRQKLGKAEDESDTEDYWEFEGEETARILYDAKKNVRAISINYNAPNDATPTAQKIFGAKIDPKPDGSVYKMMEYPKEGFWISYVRTAGETPLVIVTIQKRDT
jgi:hypothetical protein